MNNPNGSTKNQARNALPDATALINANMKRFEKELKNGYEKFRSASLAKSDGTSPVADISYAAWAFRQVDAVFSDMLEARVDHRTPEAYTQDIAARLNMKIKWAIEEARKAAKAHDGEP